MTLTPVEKGQRIETLDLLRGISLLGILLVNILSFNYPATFPELRDYLSATSDQQIEKFLTIFIQGSFYPLFAGLFGYGLQMQFSKAKRLGQPFFKTGSKRLAVLLAIGLLHAFFIWYGDILTMYAIFGFILLPLLRLKPLIQTLIAGILLLLFNGLMTFTAFIYSFLSTGEEATGYLDIESLKSTALAYGQGSWMDAYTQRLQDLSEQFGIGSFIVGLVTLLPIMLIGAAASQWQLVERVRRYWLLWSALLVIGLVGGIVLKAFIYSEPRRYFWDIVGYYVGGPLLTLGYAALIVLLAQLPYLLKITQPIRAVGRMSLTIYLLQSIILSIIFYGYGFGLYGKLTMSNIVLVALALYIFLTAFATIWLAYCKQGPVEKLWKKITYSNINGK